MARDDEPKHYDLRFKPRAVKDLESLPARIQDRVLERLVTSCSDLQGDIKRLTGFSPEYRLRVGEYRVLFELDGDAIVVYRVRKRGDAYR